MPDRSCISRQAVSALQWDRLHNLIDLTASRNPFYQNRWKDLGPSISPRSIEDFQRRFPLLTKEEISRDQLANPPFGSNLNFPLDAYTRCHQTSGTGGPPIRWLDTPESWEAMTRHWMIILKAAGVGAGDRLLFAFSFGPFLGFWLAFESASRLGCLCFPAGGLTTSARVRQILDLQITAVCCTPTYALRLSEVARLEHADLSTSKLQRWIVAGEPGGSIPETRHALESAWPRARVFDHHGMTESGPVTYECPKHPCTLHLIETAFLAEVLDPATGAAVPEGDIGELVLTTLERTGSPLIRYRTGDLVRLRAPSPCACGTVERTLEGGILGRADDMVVVRGVNVYPGAVEALVRSSGPVAEFQVLVSRRSAMAEISIEVEYDCESDEASKRGVELVRTLEASLSLRVPVSVKPRGSLPRFEMKARRWIQTGPL